MKRLALLVLSGLCFATYLHADDATNTEPEHHAAHEHGVGTLSIAISVEQVEIILESPAANLVGFEHTARTDEEKQKLLAATQTLQAADQLFTLPDAAQCKLDNASINTTIDGSHDADHAEANTHHDADHAEHAADSHSDIDVTWTYQCANAEAINSLGVKLFSAFPNGFTKLNAEWVTDTGASAAQLTADGELNLQP